MVNIKKLNLYKYYIQQKYFTLNIFKMSQIKKYGVIMNFSNSNVADLVIKKFELIENSITDEIKDNEKKLFNNSKIWVPAKINDRNNFHNAKLLFNDNKIRNDYMSPCHICKIGSLWKIVRSNPSNMDYLNCSNPKCCKAITSILLEI